MPSCICAVVLRAPLRERAEPFDRALEVRADPFRDRAVPLLDAFDCARLPALAAVRAVFVAAWAVRVFAARAFFLAAPLPAELAREAGFDAAVLRERLVVLLAVLVRDRFVVAMSSSQVCDPRILRPVPAVAPF
jgi:hypothetical protein